MGRPMATTTRKSKASSKATKGNNKASEPDFPPIHQADPDSDLTEAIRAKSGKRGRGAQKSEDEIAHIVAVMEATGFNQGLAAAYFGTSPQSIGNYTGGSRSRSKGRTFSGGSTVPTSSGGGVAGELAALANRMQAEARLEVIRTLAHDLLGMLSTMDRRKLVLDLMDSRMRHAYHTGEAELEVDEPEDEEGED